MPNIKKIVKGGAKLAKGAGRKLGVIKSKPKSIGSKVMPRARKDFAKATKANYKASSRWSKMKITGLKRDLAEIKRGGHDTQAMRELKNEVRRKRTGVDLGGFNSPTGPGRTPRRIPD